MTYDDTYCDNLYAQIADYERLNAMSADSEAAEVFKKEAMYKTSVIIVKELWAFSKRYYGYAAELESGEYKFPEVDGNAIISEEYSSEYINSLSVEKLSKLFYKNRLSATAEGMEYIKVNNMVNLATALGYEYERMAEEWDATCESLFAELHPEVAE